MFLVVSDLRFNDHRFKLIHFSRFQFEFLDACSSACIFGSAFVLVLEWVRADKRVLSSTIIEVCFSSGLVVLGFIAMYIQHFRYFLLAIYVPGLLVISYYWTVSESVRWLLATKRFRRAEKTLLRAAKFNNVSLSDQSLEIIRRKCHPNPIEVPIDSEVEDQATYVPLTAVFTSRCLFWRLVALSICWTICTFIYYGLNLSATQINGGHSKYVSFILVVGSEIPGFLIAVYVLDRAGRRNTVVGALAWAGISIISSALITTDSSVLALLMVISGKCAITCAFASIYVFAAELWPTSLRNTLLNVCSMIGRIGAMAAPLTPLLVRTLTSQSFSLFQPNSRFRLTSQQSSPVSSLAVRQSLERL